MMPNLDIANNKTIRNVTLFYDYGTKKYGVRETHEIIRDGVHIEASKSLLMSQVELEKLIEDVKTFIKERP